MRKYLGVLLSLVVVLSLVGCTKHNEENQLIGNDQNNGGESDINYDDFEMKYSTVMDVSGNDVKLKFGEPKQEEENTEQKEAPNTGEAGAMTEAMEGTPLRLDHTGEEEEIRIDSSIEVFGMGQPVTIKEIKKGDILQMEYYQGKLIKISIM